MRWYPTDLLQSFQDAAKQQVPLLKAVRVRHSVSTNHTCYHFALILSMRTVRTFILILMICVTYDIHVCLDDKRITRNSRFNLNSISCDGSKSCANADMNIIDATDVSCHGYACINANIILQDCDSTLKSNVYCYGKQSCLNTTIDLGNTTQVNCYIIYSCAHSNMTVSSFGGHAYYGVINSVICGDTDTTSHIYLKFDYSGYNLTIFCHYTSIRNIYCDFGWHARVCIW